MRHPRRHEVSRDVGSEPRRPDDPDFVELIRFPFEPDSALLLCSDGLSDMIPSAEMLRALERHAGDPRASARELVRLANDAGGRDNVSVIVVEGEAFAAGRPRPRGSGPAGELGPGTEAAAAVRNGLLGSGSSGIWIVLLALLAGLLAWRFLAPRPAGPAPPEAQDAAAAPPRLPVVVGPGSAGLATIGAALEAARPGDRIEVLPGEYDEAIRLVDSVTLVARAPGEAVIAPRRLGPDRAAVTAERIRGARFSGFVVRGAAGVGPADGVRIAGSEIELSDLDVSGAGLAGIRIEGDARATLVGSHVHRNLGSGVVIAGRAAARLVGNVIERNGGAPGLPGPGIDVAGAVAPDLVRNLIAENAAEGIRLRRSEWRERFVDNFFGAADRRNRAGNVGVARE
jgi:hypothetical protein